MGRAAPDPRARRFIEARRLKAYWPGMHLTINRAHPDLVEQQQQDRADRERDSDLIEQARQDRQMFRDRVWQPAHGQVWGQPPADATGPCASLTCQHPPEAHRAGTCILCARLVSRHAYTAPRHEPYA